jgi:hypothetical protein
MRVRYNAELLCKLNQHDRTISAQQGRYVDLKFFPERAIELPESHDWPALGSFIEAVNRCAAFRTTGCQSLDDSHDHSEGAFVEIAFDDPRLRLSGRARAEFQNALLTLDGHEVAGDFVVELRDCGSILPTGESLESTRFMLLGTRHQAEFAFQPILELLQRQNVADYLRLAHGEIVDGGPRRGCTLAARGCLVVAMIIAAFVAGMYVSR